MGSFVILFDPKEGLLQYLVYIREYDKLNETLKSKEYDVNNGDWLQSIPRDYTNPFKGWTPLHISAHINDIKSAQILLNSGANVNAKTDNSYTPFHIAVMRENYEMSSFLILNKADINAMTIHKETALEMLIERNDLKDLMNLLLRNGVKYTGKHFEEHPLIFRAIAAKNMTLIEFLAKNDHNSYYYKNMSPLEYAIDVYPQCVNILIKTGRQIYFPNQESGDYPIHLAVRMKRFDWIKLLCEMGVNTNFKDHSGNRPLHIVAETYSPEEEEESIRTALFLIYFEANPNLKNSCNLTPLSLAAQNDKIELMEALIRSGTILSANLSELKHAFSCKKFSAGLVFLKNCTQINESIRFDSEFIIWYFVKHSVGEQEVDIQDMKTIMQKLIDMTPGINSINSIWGHLMHYLIYADICSPTPCFRSLFDVLINSHKCDINFQFMPKDTQLKSGELIPVQRIMANGTALSFALEMNNSGHYSEALISLCGDYSTIKWDYIFFAPEKTKSLKMLYYSGCPLPDSFREDSDPIYDENVDEHQMTEYRNKFQEFIQWLDTKNDSPLSLKQSSRKVIRKTLGVNGCRLLNTKGPQIFSPQFNPFPNSLCDYLLFKSYEDFN